MSRKVDVNVVRRMMGPNLRGHREGAGLTQRKVAEELDWSLSKVIRIETGAHGVSVTDLNAMLDLYGVTDDGVVAELRKMARDSRGQPWWNEYRELVSPQLARYLGYEDAAVSFRVFHPFLIPGLLHTETYAQELLGAHSEPDRIRRVSELRTLRQERTLSQPGVVHDFIVNEEALYRWVGGPRRMRQQLQRLLDMGSRPGISLSVVPFSAGAHPGLLGPFIILRLKDSGDEVVFKENAGGDQLIRDDPEQIAQYAAYFEELRERALPRDQADALLKEQIKRLGQAP